MIYEVSEETIKAFWKEHLWTNIEIRPSSSIVYGTYPYEYNLNYHKTKKIFLGLFEGEELVGVNSLHRTDDEFRSRGLVVLPKCRGKGYGKRLLLETIKLSNGKVWSMPKRSALQTYLSVGFVKTSEFFETETSEANCFVAFR